MIYPANINKLSLGEGNTPLIRLHRLENFTGWRGRIWAKAEYQNPTGSFKDRGSITEIKAALKLKKSGVVCASTGNMAASLAAYAARAGLFCRVVIPAVTPATKLKQALSYGAILIKVAGSYDDCVVKARQIAGSENFLLCGDYQTRRIGQRSLGRELADSGPDFDAFICPVGNGTLGCAISEGYNCVQKSAPGFIGVQAFGADPIAQAWKNGKTIIPIPKALTSASAMCVGNPLDGALTLKWVQKTKGLMLSVTDEAISNAQQRLAFLEGIYVEKAAAASAAALSKISANQYPRIILILTGLGLKEG